MLSVHRLFSAFSLENGFNGFMLSASSLDEVMNDDAEPFFFSKLLQHKDLLRLSMADQVDSEGKDQ